MKHDIAKFIGLLLAAGAVGWSLNVTLLCMLVMAIAIIGWQIHRLKMLYRWVENPGGNPMPEMSGQFYQLHRVLSRKNDQNSKRKRRLTEFVSQFRRAIGALPDAIVLIGNDGKIEWANTNADRILGIRWPADAGVRFINLIRYPEVDKLLVEQDPPSNGVEVTAVLDREVTINIKCVRYTNKLRMVIARDVSRLMRVSKIHTDFVANVSHELKTPLTVLRGYLEILQNSQELPDKFIKPIAQMNLQGARMQSIVSDLLYLAKLEDHADGLPMQAVDITHVINTIVEAIQPLLAGKQHKLELDIDYSLQIRGIQTELHSAFTNLITNAIHYTPDGGLIKVRWVKDRGDAIFAVKDNGIGIAPQYLDRLTQRFYRVDNDRSRDSGGTGLGLAIVKHVLQRHNGQLHITSNEDVGSEFVCQFPAYQAVTVATPSPDSEAS